MQTYQINLSVPSGFVTPWQADTIFGHLCWAAERHDCFQRFSGASGLINLFRRSEPPFIHSHAIPSGLLPAPVSLKNLYSQAEDEPIDTERYALMKRAKKTAYLTIDQFQEFQKGQIPKLADDRPKGFLSATVLHNSINRMTNTTGSQGSLFETDEIYAAEGEIQIYIKIKEGFENDVRLLFEKLSYESFGAKKSTGKGAFSVKCFVAYNGFDLSYESRVNKKIGGFISLSHFVPKKSDPTEGAYKSMIKYGKLGEEKTFCGQPFKKPLIMLKPGAVFRTDNVKLFYGRLVGDIAYADNSIVQYGFAFPVPIVLSQL
jgi:CRISPR-associated protein Csm4